MLTLNINPNPNPNPNLNLYPTLNRKPNHYPHSKLSVVRDIITGAIVAGANVGSPMYHWSSRGRAVRTLDFHTGGPRFEPQPCSSALGQGSKTWPSTFPGTNCMISFQINPHWILSNSGLWKAVLETFCEWPGKLMKGVRFHQDNYYYYYYYFFFFEGGTEKSWMVPNQENMEGDQPVQSHSHAQQPLQPQTCVQSLSWWNRTPYVSFPGHSRNVSSINFQSPEWPIQYGFIRREAMQNMRKGWI